MRSGATPEKLLPADDARAYRRFLDWSVGYGFKLAVVELSAAWKRDALVAWTASAVPGTRTVRLDEASREPLRDLFEKAAAPPGETAVLVLTHLEEASNRRRVCAQLNVQRDDLARAFAVPWVVIVHPHAALEMQRDAPDFSDFAGLWLRDEEPPAGATAILESRAPTLGPSVSGSVEIGATGLLRQAEDALDAGHYDRARDLLAQHGIAHPEEERSPTRLLVSGRLSCLSGQFGEARAKFEEALRTCDAGGDERTAAAALHNLGSVLLAQGDLAGARDRLERSLRIDTKVHGTEEHPDVAASLHVLAGVFEAQGDLAAARAHLERSLRIWAKVYGTEEPPEVAASLHELARVLLAQGDLAGARDRLERSLRIDTKVHGTEEHPSVAASLHELARVLLAQGDLAGARDRAERSLRIKAKVYGTEEHPSVAASLHELARVLRAQGDLAGARDRLERALRTWAKVYGTEEHPAVAASLHELARVLWAQGDLAGARVLYERVLAIEERLYGGREHYSTAITEASLGILLMEMGERQSAAPLFQHAHQVFLTRLGPEHPHTKRAAQLLRADD